MQMYSRKSQQNQKAIAFSIASNEDFVKEIQQVEYIDEDQFYINQFYDTLHQIQQDWKSMTLQDKEGAKDFLFSLYKDVFGIKPRSLWKTWFPN